MYPLYKVLAFQQTFVCVSCKCVYAREYMRASVCARVRAGTCVCVCMCAYVYVRVLPLKLNIHFLPIAFKFVNVK